MNVENIINTMDGQIDKAENQINSLMGSDMSDPGNMLKMQYAIQQYNVMINYESAVLKTVKDMMLGIISKIG